jgi:integrase/recombinase XerD
MNKPEQPLPEVYRDYLEYRNQTNGERHKQTQEIKRVISKLHIYLENNQVRVEKLGIEHIDGFLAELSLPYALSTRRLHRSCLRGFLGYLYHQRCILKRDLAPFVVGPPLYGQSRPPNYLRPQEIKKLFKTVQLSTPGEIRTYAMLHLAYTLGLRSREISLITLEDIEFTHKRLRLRKRKADNPIVLPLTEPTLKAIATYIIGARPDSDQRALFLTARKSYKPITANCVSRDIGLIMKKAGLNGTSYWLRHTYAQNILESGGSIFEVKEMMGHDRIQSAESYLHIHIKMMREVLFNETV